MANPFKGEASIAIGGKSYRMKFTLNAMAAAESAGSTNTNFVTFEDISKRAEKGRTVDVRLLFWASLLEYQPFITLADAGNLLEMVDLGEVARAFAAMNAQSQPDPRDLKAVGGGKRPRRGAASPAAGTTTPS